ncbi:MAG: serine hydrolase [Candidatus Obscuribacterales bacterium]|nr:serine hydrolase [Candidatus Obscuribacterales bacterium]
MGKNRDLKEELEEYMEASVECLDFSGSVLVHKKGKVLLSAGYGEADREHNVPCKADTIYRIASITKQFTAMAIMILVDQDKLALNDKISIYLNRIPKSWQSITIKHLLCHTSGIQSYTDLPDFEKTKKESATPEEIIARIKKLPLNFSPGRKTEYSNTGYIILGHIIEKVSGRSYEGFLQETIFGPLAMNDSGYDHPEVVMEDRARGYARPNKNELLNAPYIDMNLPFAAGGLCSTVEDLYKWERALGRCDLIPKKLTDIMFTPVKNGFACGWMVDEQQGHKRVQHAGGIDGFSTMIIRYFEDDAAVIVLSNVQSCFYSAPSVAAGLSSILLGEDYKLPKVRTKISVDPKISKAYVGLYKLFDDTVLAVRQEADQLTIQAGGQPVIEIFPESETEYFVDDFDAQITFCRTGKRISHILWHQGGSVTTGKKV